MKCDFCDGKIDYSGEEGKMFMQEIPFLDPVPRLYVWVGDERAVFRIKYCPMCGRKLDEE
jgi:hypothetical protein